MKYCVLKANGVEAYDGAIAGGKLTPFWPRQVQSPIGATPLTGRVGSLVAVPEGSVPPGKTLPLITNGPPGFAPPAPVRQSHATSKVRVVSPAAFTTSGNTKTATLAKPARP